MALLGKADKKTLPDAKALRGMDVKELETKLAEQQDALMRARFQHATAALENTAELKSLRRQIARIYTVINEKRERG